MSDKLRVLDLFSGIGGFSLGLERTGGFETVAFCEIEPFPRKVLAKHWPDVPCFEDVRKLTRKDIDGPVHLICGGYPCQPFSTAGQRLGKEDDRHLWPEVNRLLDEFRPAWFIGENVAGHVSMGLDDVLSDLENKDYTCRTFIIPAVSVNAVHRRDRVWIVGHANKNSREQCSTLAVHNAAEQHNQFNIQPTTNAEFVRQQGQGEFGQSINPKATKHWKASKSFNALERPSQPAIRGTDDGVPGKLDNDRLASLGNAVVPQIPEMLGRAILQATE